MHTDGVNLRRCQRQVSGIGNRQRQTHDPRIPTDPSALLAEYNEAWQERKCLDMDEFDEWAAACCAKRGGGNGAALPG